ncbi:hypothetical protein [Microcoleus sp.]
MILTHPSLICIHCGTGQKASAIDRFQKGRSPFLKKSAIALFNS